MKGYSIKLQEAEIETRHETYLVLEGLLETESQHSLGAST